MMKKICDKKEGEDTIRALEAVIATIKEIRRKEIDKTC